MDLVHSTRQLIKRLYYKPTVQKTVLRMARPIVRPPYSTPTMEFDYGLWLGISAIHCVDGRQLGEDNTWPKIFREPIPTEFRESNMPGSRSGLKINMTTLHIVMKAWTETLPVVAALRSLYLSNSLPGLATLSIPDVYLVSRLGVSVPALMARRHNQPVADGEIPRPIATQFKIIAGLFMIVRNMLQEGHLEWLRKAEYDSDELFDYADSEGVLISPNAHACGGSRRKIVELIELLRTGRHSYADDSQSLSEHVDVQQLMAYAAEAQMLELCMQTWQWRLSARYQQYLAMPCADTDGLYSRRVEALEVLTNRLSLLAPIRDHAPAEFETIKAEIEATPLSSGADVQAHYVACSVRAARQCERLQRRLNAILGENRRVNITPKLVRKRLGVLSKGQMSS